MFKKGLVILFAAALIVFGTVMRHFKRSSSEANRCYSKKSGFSIEFPSNWDIRRESKKETTMAMSPWKNGARGSVSIYVKKLSKDLSPEEYFEEWLEDYKQHETGELTVDGRRARYYITTIRTDWRVQPASVTAVHYVLANKGRAYIIVGAVISGKFPEYRDNFEKIAKSFKFE